MLSEVNFSVELEAEGGESEAIVMFSQLGLSMTGCL